MNGVNKRSKYLRGYHFSEKVLNVRLLLFLSIFFYIHFLSGYILLLQRLQIICIMKPRGAIPRLNNCSNCSGDAWFFCHFCKSDLCYRCNDNHDCQMKDFDHLFKTITDNKDLYIGMLFYTILHSVFLKSINIHIELKVNTRSVS